MVLIIALIVLVLVVVGAVFNSAKQNEINNNESTKEETIKVKAYFNNSKLDPEFSCNKVFPVEREIVKTPAVARAALEELFKGLTEAEKEAGFFTSINPGVKIQKLSIENSVASVDFDEQLEFQVGGSCRVSAIRAQITETLKQFSTVNSVIISINGRTEDILQP
jgi:spore germination protein GerM